MAAERRQGAGSKLDGVQFFFPYSHMGTYAVFWGEGGDCTPVRALLRNLIKLRRNVVFLRSEVSGRVYSWGYMLMRLFM